MNRVWGITLSVSDLEKSKRFYEKVLGLVKKYEYSSYVGFECGGVELGLTPKEKPEMGRDAPSIEFFVKSVDEAGQELKEKGVKFKVEPHDEPWGTRQASFQDPDGNVLELTEINWKRYFTVSSEGAQEA